MTAFFEAVLLAAGTCLGAGMLALPILTGLAGFWPACLIYFLSWSVITYASFLLLEVNLAMKDGVNLVSMAKSTLSKPGEIIAFATYIFLFYGVSIAYLSGSGSIINDLLGSLFHITLPNWVGIFISLSLFGPSIYFGARTVANVNMILVIGIGVSYLLLITLGGHLVEPSKLQHVDWSYAWMGIPVIVTSFTFQNVIPTLTTYLKRDVTRLKGVIILGGLLPLCIYILWQWFVLGIVPTSGANSFTQLIHQGLPISHALKNLLKSPSVVTFSQIFAFCAIITSFLGVILGLFDFMADGFKIKKSGRGKLLLCAIIFIPPFFFSIAFPGIFLSALNYAGSFGCVTLFVLLPALMVWRKRYHLKQNSSYQAPGGKLALIAIILLGFSIFAVQICLTSGILKSS
ncbi:MAG: Tyrosine-specific transport protein [Chlamydiae bacterium]|nr:Tyrosine-specific transport protein [Chlamydiota bacterium]